MAELKSCPFCGSVAKLIVHRFHGLPSTYGIHCTNMECQAQGNQFYDIEQDAVDAWNRRKGTDCMKYSVYDIEELHENCTVQVLTNSVTGEISVGWWENEQ